MARIRLFSVSRERVLKILYICTHNRCRSILSEAVSNHFGQGFIEARSAGSDPAGEVHPESLKALTAEGERVAVEAGSLGKHVSGKIYNNHFHILMVIRDGKVQEWKEYMDTMHANDVFFGGPD